MSKMAFKWDTQDNIKAKSIFSDMLHPDIEIDNIETEGCQAHNGTNNPGCSDRGSKDRELIKACWLSIKDIEFDGQRFQDVKTKELFNYKECEKCGNYYLITTTQDTCSNKVEMMICNECNGD
jgi:hypothetical protein